MARINIGDQGGRDGRTRDALDEVFIAILLLLSILPVVVVCVGLCAGAESVCGQGCFWLALSALALVLRWCRGNGGGCGRWGVVGGLAIDGGCEGADELVVRREEVESRDEVLCAGEEGGWLWSPCAQNKTVN